MYQVCAFACMYPSVSEDFVLMQGEIRIAPGRAGAVLLYPAGIE